MNGKIKILLLIALIFYCISPIDLVPGPIDDIILCIIYAISSRRGLRVNKEANLYE